MSEEQVIGTESVVDSGNSVVETPPVDTGNKVEGITRDDFRTIAPSLRKRSTEQNNSNVTPEGSSTKPEEEVIPGSEVEPPEGGGSPKAKDEPENKPPEGNVEPPTKIILPSGEEMTIEQILELKKGSMLHADYTRKTQDLANDRKSFQEELDRAKQFEGLPIEDALDLWERLGNDPIGTLRFLEEEYNKQGVTEPEDPVALQAKIDAAKLKKENENLKKQAEDNEKAKKEREEQVQFELYMDELAVKYKDQDFDKATVIEYCLTNKISNPELAFKAMLFDNPPKANVEDKVKTLEEENKKLKDESKNVVSNYIKDKVMNSANFTPPVGSGNSSSGVVVEKPKTWAASRKAAMARLGG